MYKDTLTTARIRKKFKNSFDLCNFSINIAQNILRSGTQSTLGQILEEIEKRADEAIQNNETL